MATFLHGAFVEFWDGAEEVGLLTAREISHRLACWAQSPVDRRRPASDIALMIFAKRKSAGQETKELIQISNRTDSSTGSQG